MAIAVKRWDTGQHTNGLLSYILYLSEQARFEINSTIPFTLAPPKMKYLGISTIKYVPNARKMLKLQWMESKNERRKRHSVYRDERWQRESLYSPPLDLSTTCITAALAPNTARVVCTVHAVPPHNTSTASDASLQIPGRCSLWTVVVWLYIQRFCPYRKTMI